MRPSLYLAGFLAGALATGCVETFNLAAPSGGAGHWLPDRFWPPPYATSLWTAGPCGADAPLGELADRVHAALASAGYTDQRWFAVGAGYAHGFSVSTRLERIRADGAFEVGNRFSPRHEGAANLDWLDDARSFTAPDASRFRVLLVAVTELPLTSLPHRAPLWNADTWLGEAPLGDLPVAARASARYRLGVYVYEYRATGEGSDADARFVPGDEASVPAATHVTMAGLTALPCASERTGGL